MERVHLSDLPLPAAVHGTLPSATQTLRCGTSCLLSILHGHPHVKTLDYNQPTRMNSAEPGKSQV